MRGFVIAQSHVEARTAAGFDEAGGDELVVRFDHGRAADARFLRAIADGRQARPGPQRVVLDALRETRGELCGQAVVLFGLQRHI
jgi:hypothetical protein